MKIGHLLEYVVFETMSFVVGLLSLKGARRLGGSLGKFAFHVLRFREEVTLSNLRRCFPEKSDAELKQIAAGAFESVGIALMELVWLPRMSLEQMKNEVRFDRPELVREVHARGNGLLLLTAHFGSWEFLAQGFHVTLGIPLNMLVKTQTNKLVDRSINRRRMLFGNKVIAMETSLREVLRALRDGEVVGIAADQAAPKENVPIEFFGTMVPTHLGPAVLSLKMNSPILAFFPIRQADGSYHVSVVQVPSDDLKGQTDENVIELTRRHVKITEDVIRRFPEQWMWMHKRWKHVPAENSPAQQDQDA